MLNRQEAARFRGIWAFWYRCEWSCYKEYRVDTARWLPDTSGTRRKRLSPPPGTSPLLDPEEPAQRPFRPTRNHRQHLTGVTTRDHGHIPMPAPYRIFIDQQHPSGPGPATLRHPPRVGSHQAHDPMPTHPMMAGHRPNRHHPGIPDQATNKPPSQAPRNWSRSSKWRSSQFPHQNRRRRHTRVVRRPLTSRSRTRLGLLASASWYFTDSRRHRSRGRASRGTGYP